MIGKTTGYVVTGFLALLLLIAVFSSFTVIDPGYTGVIFNQINGSLRAVPQGLAFKIPFVTKVQSYPTALRTYTMVQKHTEGSEAGDDSLDLPTKEGQHIKQDLSVTYNTNETRAADVFRSFKGADISEIEVSFVRRTIITAAQNMAGSMSLTDLISGDRGKLQDAIEKVLNTEFNKMGFTLDKVNLGASHLPKSIEEQMQTKMAAQQEAQQAEYELQKQQILAKARVAEAEGKAKSNIIEAKAQSEANRMLQVTLTPMLIRVKAIEKWDGGLPRITGGTVPFIDVTKHLDKEE
jgi:regulator of protease activity HflC (stomatin/prohibitin superfamily)